MPNKASNIAPIIPKTAAITPPPIPGPIYAEAGLLKNNSSTIKIMLFMLNALS